ncbi:hypothetical protein RFH42_01950 [Acinetobacter rudis]|uniref:hypothetical protein n=1 Tax=Acinetobacter rudis TaxID=632955 RepID=UPI00280E7AAC|nr:hypothetical protein [Acinetobacter rudis]MDQ8951722.1 hypothetical protein [Acinetobacter rudis]
MSLSEEIFEWRKQIVEKLLLQGNDIKAIEENVKKAEQVIYGDCISTFRFTCAAKYSKELLTTLNDFAIKNNCSVDILDD